MDHSVPGDLNVLADQRGPFHLFFRGAKTPGGAPAWGYRGLN